MTLRSAQSLTEISTRNLPGGTGCPARKADNLTAICEPIIYKNREASTSHIPMTLHGQFTGVTLPLYYINSDELFNVRRTFLFIY
jgi:hypothetical protein